MRVRLYAEVDLDDGKLLDQFGAQLPALTAAHEIEAGLARATETLLHQIAGVIQAKVVFIPTLLDQVDARRVHRPSPFDLRRP